VPDIDSRLAVLETRLAYTLDLLERHMKREEATTQLLIDRLDHLDARLNELSAQVTRWRGVAAGAALVVSAGWAVLLAAVAWLR
jgi:uncharacterized coiled-coil protein SlyX